MRGRYTQVPADTFRKLVMNAGIMAKNFNPSTGAVTGLVGATTGGLQFEATPDFKDFGEDVDNLPKNTKQMKQIDDDTVHVSGTLLTLDTTSAKSLMAAADIDPNDSTHIIPRMNLTDADFEDIWVIADYSDENTGASAGFVALHLMDVLNTGGFKLNTTDRGKGQFPFDYTAHFDMNDPDKIPYEVYVKAGGSAAPFIELDRHTVSIEDETTVTLKATTYPTDATVTWTSSDTSVATVADGVVTAKDAGNAIIAASITVDGVTYNDTCTVIVTTAED